MLGVQIGINRSGGALSNLASKAGAVMHLDVSDLVSPTVIRDKQQGNNATLYNFAGTAASGIQLNEYTYPWTIRTTPNSNNWQGIAYGNGVYVSVSDTGTTNRVMTSPDGETWTARTTPNSNNWSGICFGNGLFVAVAYSGVGNRVMTSPDGETWTARTSAADNNWVSICYGNGLYVAVADTGTGNRVMTSPDGETWTIRSTPADNNWKSVTYGNGLYVAVARTGSGNRVMTSPDGETWTLRTSAADNDWRAVIHGNGLYVAISSSGTGNRVMTSPDGETWTIRTSAADNSWVGLAYGDGLFVATAFSGTGNRVMSSPDATTWTARTSAADNNWYNVCYGNGKFVATSSSGTTNRVMTMPYTYSLGFGSRPCKKYDGVDDYCRVLTPSAATNITTEQFAIGFVVYMESFASSTYIIAYNNANAASFKFAVQVAATTINFYMNGVNIPLTAPSVLTLNVWHAIIIHRDVAGNLSLLKNGSVTNTGTYVTALPAASNLMLGCRSNSVDGTVVISLFNGYINHEFIAVGSRATIANVKAFQSAQATKYGITYT